MTYKLVNTIKVFVHDSNLTQYVFEQAKSSKKWYLDFNTETNTVVSLVCTGSWEDFRFRRHCVPKVINEFIEQLKLMNML